MKTAILLTVVDQDGVICIIRHEMITETIHDFVRICRADIALSYINGVFLIYKDRYCDTSRIVNILNDAGIHVQEDEIGGDSVLRFSDKKSKMLFRLKHG